MNPKYKIEDDLDFFSELYKLLDIDEDKDKIDESFDWDLWNKRALEFFTPERVLSAFKPEKKERTEAYSTLKEEFINLHQKELETNSVNTSQIDYVFDENFKLKIDTFSS
jgi:hypothetical protein